MVETLCLIIGLTLALASLILCFSASAAAHRSDWQAWWRLWLLAGLLAMLGWVAWYLGAVL